MEHKKSPAALDSVEAVVCAHLADRHQTLATAESCSGGLVAHCLTNVPGASAVFLGGVVAYCNTIKERLLGVPPVLLAEHGAVSEPVAQAMAKGVRERFASDYGVGVTGIAGPTGGTVEKPVGTVCIAVAGPEGMVVRRYQFSGSRDSVKAQTAETALTMLEEYIA